MAKLLKQLVVKSENRTDRINLYTTKEELNLNDNDLARSVKLTIADNTTIIAYYKITTKQNKASKRAFKIDENIYHAEL